MLLFRKLSIIPICTTLWVLSNVILDFTDIGLWSVWHSHPYFLFLIETFLFDWHCATILHQIFFCAKKHVISYIHSDCKHLHCGLQFFNYFLAFTVTYYIKTWIFMLNASTFLGVRREVLPYFCSELCMEPSCKQVDFTLQQDSIEWPYAIVSLV